MEDFPRTASSSGSGPDSAGVARPADVRETFERGAHLYSTRTAEGFEALEKKGGERVTLWLLRFPLRSGSEESSLFAGRLRRISELKLPTPAFRDFGVDASGTAYLVVDAVATKPVIDCASDPLKLARVFIELLQVVAPLHRAGISLGDIAEDTFRIDPQGKVMLNGLLGSFESGARQTAMLPPVDTLHFLAPEQRSGSAPDIATDVYALGVYGYRLFTGRYLHGDRPPTNAIENPAASAPAPSIIRPGLANWIDAVIGKCLDIESTVRYADAEDILRVIEESIRTGEAPPGKNPWARRTATVSPEAVDEITNSSSGLTAVVDKKRPPAEKPGKGPQAPAKRAARNVQQQSARGAERESGDRLLKMTMWVLALVIGASIAGFIFFSIDGWEEKPVEPVVEKKDAMQVHSEYAPPELKPLILEVSSAQVPVGKRKAALETIARSEDPIAHAVLVSVLQGNYETQIRSEAERLLIEKIRSQELERAADVIDKWLSSADAGKSSPASSPAFALLVRSSNRARPIDSRKSALQQAYEKEPVVALQMAAALALDESTDEFAPIVKKFLSKELDGQELEGKGFGALLLSHKALSMFVDSSVVETIKKFSDQDLRWALGQAAKQSDEVLLTELTLEMIRRDVLPPYQTIFLLALRDSGTDTRWEVKRALTAGALGNVGEEEIQTVARWTSMLAERVLLAVCATSPDPAVALSAFDVLAGRTIQTEPAASLFDWVKTKFWDYRKRTVKAIGILGLADVASRADLDYAFESLLPFSKGGLFRVMIETGNVYLVREAVRRLGAITPSTDLVELLGHEDKETRILAVQALKGRNELGVLQGILRSYDREKDPEVRQAYNDAHWVTRREQQPRPPVQQ